MFGTVSGIFPGRREAYPFAKPMLFVEEKERFLFRIFSSTTTTSVYRNQNGLSLFRLGRPYFGKSDDAGKPVMVCDLKAGTCKQETVDVNDFARDYIPRVGKDFSEKAKSSGSFGYAGDVWYAASDISAVARNIAWLHNPISPDPGLTAGFGYTSAGGAITGPLQIAQASYDLENADRISDVAGARIALVKFARGVSETVSGLAMGALRTVSLIGVKTASQTVVTAGTILGYLSTGTASLFFAFLAVQFGIGAARSFSAMQELKKEPAEAFQFLQDKALLTLDDLNKCVESIDIDSPVKLYHLIKGAITLTEQEHALLTEEEKQYICDEVFSKVAVLQQGEYLEIEDWGSVTEHLQVRALKEAARMKLVKEAEYRRIFGNESLEMIKTGGDQDTILPLAHAEAKFRVIMNSLIAITAVLGIASFILTTVFSGGTFLILGYAIMLVMNLIMAGADAYGLYQSILSLKESSWKDLLLLGLFFVLSIGATAAGAFFTGGVGMLVLVLVLGALTVGVQAGTMAYAWNKYKKEDEEISGSEHVPLLPSEHVGKLPDLSSL